MTHTVTHIVTDKRQQSEWFFLQAVEAEDWQSMLKTLPTLPDKLVSNRFGWTALHIAVMQNNQDIVLWLLEQGFAVNAQDHAGWTPLLFAVTCEHIDICHILLRYQADPNLYNHQGLSAQDLAMPLHNPALSSLLLAYGGRQTQRRGLQFTHPKGLKLPRKTWACLLQQWLSSDKDRPWQ
jgi:hypothetical protein